jgi:hypothetical protein
MHSTEAARSRQNQFVTEIVGDLCRLLFGLVCRLPIVPAENIITAGLARADACTSALLLAKSPE